MVGQSDARNVTHAGFGGMNMLYTGAAHVKVRGAWNKGQSLQGRHDWKKVKNHCFTVWYRLGSEF